MLKDGDVERRIWPLPVLRVNGIGPRAAQRLAALNIHTVGDLARTARDELFARSGSHYGAWLHEVAFGRDERALVTESEPRSRSSETTFARDLDPRRDRAEIERVLAELSGRVAADLARRGIVGRTIGLKLRFDDFSTITRDRTIAQPTADAARILDTVRACQARIELRRRIRLLGVRVSALQGPHDAGQAREPDLFG